jgi:alpha-L-arabinofuranosidase
MRGIFSIIVTLFIALSAVAQPQPHKFDIKTKKVGAEIASTMYGIFFEDVNFAADGGLYAELVKNRSFEFPDHYMGWKVYGNIQLKDDGPFERNPHYVRLGYSGHDHRRTGLDNDGFTGIGYKEGEDYRFSVWARVPEGGEGVICVSLCENGSQELNQHFSQTTLKIDSKEWKRYQVVLKSTRRTDNGFLRVLLDKKSAVVDLEHISLFPIDTWKGREGGLRKDLAQSLYDLKPGVFRFPGGCIVEGVDLDTRYQWKHTVGAVENRPLNENKWNYSFLHRLFPDYFQSYGLGFYEFFLLSEDIGAEPLPILNCGLACQFQNGNPEAHVAVCDLEPYIQDAIDLIEFANGDTSTTWGKLRADMGHPEPFNLKFLGIGNEQWGKEYPERLKPFVEALRKAHPEIKIVGSSGPNSEGDQFEYLWPEMKKLEVDLVDEHFYRPEAWFLNSGMRYDSYDRNGPKVFAGEYACHGRGKKWNHFNAALMEAAFMTNLERNADIVHMATYAPLFAHVEGWQWRPDMIWFDNLRSVRTCSYYVQQLYALNKGTNVVPLNMDGKPVAGVEGQDGLFASAVWDSDSQSYIVKVINTSDKAQPVELCFAGLGKKESLADGTITTFHSDNPDLDNTVDNPTAIIPVESKITIEGNTLKTEVGAKSFAMYKFKKIKK